MSSSHLLIVERESTLYVSLNRPDIHNAFNPENDKGSHQPFYSS